MLGSVKQTWHWIGSGKHPAAGDYFKVGDFTPILAAIADWLEKGFQCFLEKEKRNIPDTHWHNSWRFWVRSPKPDHIVAGVVRDSSDSLGRPFPFLVAGTGPLKKCQDRWEMLPFACEPVWAQMEYLGTGQYEGVQQLGERVDRIHPPTRDWSRAQERPGVHGQGEAEGEHPHTEQEIQKIEDHVAAVQDLPGFIVSMELMASADPLTVAGLWHRILKDKLAGFPNALFMGGVPEKTCLAVFQRSLAPPDFIKLWSAHKKEDPTPT
jgi:type VI secretion system protein VasJ